MLLVMLCGCRSHVTVSEQVVVTGIGIDWQAGRYVLSIQAVEPLKTAGSLSEQSEAATAVYTAEGESVAEALQAFLNKTGKRTYILQNRILVISEALYREESLFSVLDYFVRNREGRALVDVLICRGDPAELLGLETGGDAIPAEYVAGLLEEGYRLGRSAQTQLLDVERAASGMYDVMLPIVELHGDTPTLAGTALLRDGRAAGTLTEAQTRGLLLANGEVTSGLYTLDRVTVQCDKISAEWLIQPHGEGWEYCVTIDATARVVEEGASISAERDNLLRRLEERIETEVVAALELTVRKYHSDPLGLARKTASLYRNSGATPSTVTLAFPKSRFLAEVELTLADSGFLP